MAEFDWDPRTPPEVDPEVGALQNQINYKFDFEVVVQAVFALVEKRTNFRGCRLSVLGPDLKKRALLDSPTLPKKAVRACPALSYPLPLTNDDLRYTFDIFAFESPQLRSSESPLLRECLRLLYQAVNKEHVERDYLTGFYNRHGFLPRLARALAEAERTDRPLAVLMLDLDHFKKVNDSYGHPVGDLVLAAVARAMEDGLAGAGVAGRYGGEEFIVVLPGMDANGGAAVAEQIRQKTEKLKVAVMEGGAAVVRPTTSLGVAAFPAHGRDAETLVHFADLALYEAKKGGRNRVAIYPLNAPEVQLQRLGESVRKGPPAPPADLEEKCEVISLRERRLIPERPRAVAVAGTRLYTLDGQTHRIHVYDGKAKGFVLEFGGRGEALAELEGPVDLAVTPRGVVVVVDAPSQAVKCYDVEGKFTGFLGGRGDDGAPVPGVIKGSFNWPVAVTVDPQGRILVAESLNRRVQRFDADGKFDGLEIPLIADDEPRSYQPDARDVAAGADDAIYILDAGNNVIRKYDATGEFLAPVGGPGPGGDAGRFKNLTSLEVDRGGKLGARLRSVGAAFAADGGEVVVAAEAGDVNRLQFFDRDGQFGGVLDFAKLEPKLRRLVRPGRLTVSAGGKIYVVDQEGADVLVIDFPAAGG
jgi:diguanylate cyclase (GGDEF)-like protein